MYRPRPLARLALVAATAGVAAACAAQPPPTGATMAASQSSPPPTAFSDTDRAAIKTVLEDQQRAWNQGDLDAFMQGYLRSDELVFTSGGRIRRGWQVTLDNYRRNYGASTDGMGTLAFEVLDLRPLGSDGAIMLGRYRLTGLPKRASGVFTLAFERTAEGWRIVHDHTSADPPDAPEEVAP